MPKTTLILLSKGGKFYRNEFIEFCFDNCNLENAIFNDTQLKEVNFVTTHTIKLIPNLIL
jgi:uncharacterized protein YjbI with pentapeptide repeats